jgi:Domain of Unknown Function (DUF1080)
MKRAVLPAMLAGLMIASSGLAADSPAELPGLSDAEKAAGWKLLFDGVSFAGWRGLGRDDVPSCWVIESGCIKCLGGHKGIADLATVEQFDNFELAFEWRFPKKKGNSGVKYRVQEEAGKGYAFGCEYQCMTDPDATDRHASGSLYDLFAPQGKTLAPSGEFNQSRILVQGDRLEHWLNGVKVVEAEFDSEAMKTALATSYFKKSNWGKIPLGHIALQNHHSEVLFRNLKLRVLPAKATD